MPKKIIMMSKNFSNLSVFDKYVYSFVIVIGCQFHLTVLRFVTFATFFTMNQKLWDPSFDWVAKHITAGLMSNDIAFVFFLLLGKTICSLGCSFEF